MADKITPLDREDIAEISKRQQHLDETSDDELTTFDNIAKWAPQWVMRRVLQFPQELLSLSPGELRHRALPPTKDNDSLIKYSVVDRLRYSFWREYDRAVTNKVKMVTFNLHDGICGEAHMRALYADSNFLAWIFTPPGGYYTRIQQVLDITTQKLEDIARLPLERQICRCKYQCKCPSGDEECKCTHGCICPPTPDPKLCQLIIEVHKVLEMRVHGAPLSKAEHRHLHLQSNHLLEKQRQIEEHRNSKALAAASTPHPMQTVVELISSEPTQPLTPDTIDADIAKIEAELAKKISVTTPPGETAQTVTQPPTQTE